MLSSSNSPTFISEISKKVSKDHYREKYSNSPYRYVILCETNGGELESWYYFIRYEGNEEALEYLDSQLRDIEEMVIIGDMSTFDLDLKNTVSELTAKEMTKIEINSIMFHRKFDGKLKNINLNFKSNDKNDYKICKMNRKIGEGRFFKYIEDEDIDEEDMIDLSELKENSSDEESESEESVDEDTEEEVPPPIESSTKTKKGNSNKNNDSERNKNCGNDTRNESSKNKGKEPGGRVLAEQGRGDNERKRIPQKRK